MQISIKFQNQNIQKQKKNPELLPISLDDKLAKKFKKSLSEIIMRVSDEGEYEKSSSNFKEYGSLKLPRNLKCFLSQCHNFF